jgi:hypothetical protein
VLDYPHHCRLAVLPSCRLAVSVVDNCGEKWG